MRKPGYSAALSCVLVRAESAARELGSGVTGTEHLLLALAQEKISSAGKILICQGAEGRLLRCMLLTQPRPARRSGRPGLSGAASRALDAARREAARLGAALCQPEHLLLALTRDEGYAAARVLLTLGVDLNCVFSETYDRLRIQNAARAAGGQSELKLLELYCENMLDRAAQTDPVVGREAELAQLMQVLSRRGKNNPALIGELGDGLGCNACALCAFTEPAFAKSFLEALGDETHADILAQLTVQTQRVQKRRQEAQAHRKNVKMGKK